MGAGFSVLGFDDLNLGEPAPTNLGVLDILGICEDVIAIEIKCSKSIEKVRHFNCFIRNLLVYIRLVLKSF